MHELITKFPPGHVVGSCRLMHRNQLLDVTRLKHGARSLFVERVSYQTKDGLQQTTFRRTDDFMSDAIADRFIQAWLDGIVNNRGYRVLYEDPTFRRADGITKAG